MPNAIAKGSINPIDETRLQDAVNVILTLQNEDGGTYAGFLLVNKLSAGHSNHCPPHSVIHQGWATYENNRGFAWYEQLNPSEVFGDIMIDYSYAECSMASLTALVDFRNLYPNFRSMEINHSIEHGRAFFESIQREDGSWCEILLLSHDNKVSILTSFKSSRIAYTIGMARGRVVSVTDVGLE